MSERCPAESGKDRLGTALRLRGSTGGAFVLDLSTGREALLLDVKEHRARLLWILERLTGRLVPEIHDSQLSDVGFLELKSLEAAGLIVRKKRGRFLGWRLTELGRGWTVGKSTL